MPVLTSQQRSTLETAVKQARKLAETGARNALHSLAVDHPEPFSHMSPDQRTLRNRLRHKARLLGDDLPATGNQQIDRLGYELAYENWHKMLFAKFLESNGLLMHPSGVAITMEECEELAREEGFIDKWDAAATYASKMLPAIFRTDDPLMQIQFAADDRIKLEAIIDALDSHIFTADDALGWVYQFWQSDAKAAINASGDKIDGAKLPAVTQLFTEPYMVHFLIDNTLGAWWVSRNPGVTPPVNFEYLRLLDDGTPAAGKFEGWPDKVAGSVTSPFGGGREGVLTSLDPCMGSGHFVASLFPVFAALRMYEEGLTKEEATDRVITENLHGLELDARCTQIAAFNLALTAWKFCGHYKELPEMNLACSGIAPKGKVEDWVKLVGNVPQDDKARMENGMRMLYDHFQLAPELGSLLDPSTIKADAFTASFEQLQPVLAKALEDEADKDLIERGVMASGIAMAGEILAQKYTLLITNVPFLGRGRQLENGVLMNFCTKEYFEAKGDLATTFLDRMLKNCKNRGSVSCVMPQPWLFLDTYNKFRISILKNKSLKFLARLGSGAFSQISGEVVKGILISITNEKPNDINNFAGFDVSIFKRSTEKDEGLKICDLIISNQYSQLQNPDARISLGEIKKGVLLSSFANGLHGQGTFDKECFTLDYWEIEEVKNGWVYQQTTPLRKIYGDFGATQVFRWEKGKGMLYEFINLKKKHGYSSGKWKAGTQIWGTEGVAVSGMGKLFITKYLGYAFDENVAVLSPKKVEWLNSIIQYCNSGELELSVKKIDQNLKASCNTLAKVPFEIEFWQKVASEKYPNGLPKPYSDDATQWLFHGHPIKAENPLQVSVARLLGYRWPVESDNQMELADEAREMIKAVKAFDHLTDDDGIFCIPSVNAEEAGADRLRSYLQEVFGGAWNNQTISQLLTKEGATSANLEDWLRKEFFAQHCKVFQNRPFIWNIWDGRSDGFSALVNYHRLTKENLNKLIYTYLGDWIRMCDAKKKSGDSGAEGLLSAALKLKEKLEAILLGETPYDIFVRWKPLNQQPIGWDPDLNDGVRLNIRPFVEAGVLRSKFNIKWGVDRGKNPPGSPWGEVRDNDRYLSLEEKREARTKQ